MKPLVYAICPRPPHPTRDGSSIRNFHLLRSLAEDFQVRAFVLLPSQMREMRDELPPGVEAERFPQAPRPLRRAAALAATAAGRAYSPFLYRSRPLASPILARAVFSTSRHSARARSASLASNASAGIPPGRLFGYRVGT